MHFATRFRFFFLGLLPLLAGFMASSCQSSRASFSFQPAPYRATAAPLPAPHPVLANSAVSQPPQAAAVTEAVATPVGAAAPRTARRAARLLAALPRLSAAGLATPAPTAWAQPQSRHLPRLLRQRPTHGAAESGLGGIGLYAIGVVLAILAGLGALFALIPGVSFFGGVGLAAAALVVLFLLYSLVSGGKKKKA